MIVSLLPTAEQFGTSVRETSKNSLGYLWLLRHHA